MTSNATGLPRRTHSACVLALLAAAPIAVSPAHAQTIPSDANATCTVAANTFKTWFQSGTPTLDGAVLPANSVTFPNQPNCSFYQWSMQMFLWLTSPAPVTYGGGGHIFDTSTFYDVSPPDQSGARSFIPHFPGLIRVLNLRSAQAGPNGDQVIFAKDGRLLQVAAPQTGPNGKPLIRNQSGDLVEIDRATLSAEQKPVFTDMAGKTIEHVLTPEALRLRAARVQPGAPEIVRRFVINGHPIFIDPSGNEVETEEGQAGGGGVLAAQSGSLIYYISMVNDVYAYFLTGVKDNKISPGTQFPTTQADLNKIVTFASQNNRTFVDPNALAIEIKSSWIEAGNLPNLGSYITTTATIPTWDQSNPAKWVPNGQKTVQLALVGMHVVGSTAGHPEMVWATFEHFGNAPNATYTYNGPGGLKTVAFNANSGPWLFAPNPVAGTFNTAIMQYQSPDIVGINGHNIGPTPTLRSKAWGAASDVSPNPIDGSATASNTEIISINNSVSGQMPNGDMRKNYFMTGSTWTIGGAAPTFPPNSNQVGTSALANTTMETFQQGPDNTMAHGGSNCFDCHVTNTTSVSHIFSALKPLF